MPTEIIGDVAKAGTSLIGGALGGSGPKPSNHPYFGKQAQQMQFGELGRMMNAWGDPTMENYLRGDPTGDFQKMMGQFGGQAPGGRPNGYSPGVEGTIGSFGGQMNQAPSDYAQWAQPPASAYAMGPGGYAGPIKGPALHPGTQMSHLSIDPQAMAQSKVQQFMQPGNVRFGYGGGNLGGYSAGYGGPLPQQQFGQNSWMGA